MPFTLTHPTTRQTVATCRVSDLQGSPGLGFHRLSLQISMSLERAEENQEPVKIIVCGAEVRANGGKIIGDFTPRMSEGRLYQRPVSIQTAVSLQCDLERARVEAIEELRDGGNLDLAILLDVMVGDEQQEPAVNHEVNQGVWVNVLAQMKYQKTLLLEIPIPDEHEQPELASAVGLLALAQKHLIDGRNRDAVGACRDVLDDIERALHDSGSTDPVLHQKLFEGSRSMDKAARLRVLRQALTLVTHPARHRDDVSVSINWERLDARCLIQMTAAFLAEMNASDAMP